jgi:hypothetical protein
VIESLPAGMTPSDFHAHPVRQLLSDAATHGPRGEPTPAELDALGLPDKARDVVRDGCAEVARLRTEGLGGQAWQRGDELSAEILAGLPEHMRLPEHWAPDPLASETDPAKLAAAVRDHGSGSRPRPRLRPRRPTVASDPAEDPAKLAARVPRRYF